MDKSLSKKKAQEQYLEATTVLIMDEFASVMRESMIAETKDKKIVIPESLDKRCRRLIDKEMRKRQRKETRKQLLRFAKAAVIFVVLLFGVVGLLFSTVEAFRTPIINFFLEQKEKYFEISGVEDTQNTSGKLNTNDPLAGLLPEGYELTMYETNRLGGITAMYVNDSGKYIIFYNDPHITAHRVDAEDAAAEKIKIGSCEAVLVSEAGYRLVWLDTINERMYCLETDGLSREEIIQLAKNIESNRGK